MITAIDIALEPDATMIRHVEAANARLRKVFPQGYALDATHRWHITVVQRYVRTAELDEIHAAVGRSPRHGRCGRTNVPTSSGMAPVSPGF